MKREIIDRITELFFDKLSVKTNWGRNEIMKAYNDAVVQALLDFL